ncbi:MAG: hypothetical protein SVU24_04335 [Pseudomonadota bacterium]|nr:hypothetical protein [Pseudomonadota bacterium]
MKSVDNIRWRNHLIPLLVPLLLLLGWQLSVSCGWLSTRIASATEQQTQVVDEINRSITEINDLATQGADRSRDIGSISRSLDGYAQQLQQQTGRFKV